MIKQKLIKIKEKTRKKFLIIFFISLVVSAVIFVINQNWIIPLISIIIVNILLHLIIYFKNNLKKSDRIKKIESVFPDFLQLMSSNLRAGITIDKAMLLSAREEFDPLDKEIIKTGKDITTGKNIQQALMDMSKRIGSEKVDKTILLIISGIRGGGDLAILLEQVSVNMRERTFIEKKASSNVLMYVIFIFLAVSIAAPALFALSTVLVEIMTNILRNIPQMESSVMNLPFTLSSISISTTFIIYFALIFMIVIDILACLVIGLVNKGEEKQGLKYLIPIITVSLAVFFIMRIVVKNFMSGIV